MAQPSSDDEFRTFLAAVTKWLEDGGAPAVPQTTVTQAGYPLGDRARTERQRYRRGTLPPERVAALEAIPGWTWTPRQATFNQMLAAVAEHLQTGTDENRSQTAKLPSREANWIKNQRAAYRRGTLSREKEQQIREALPGILP